MNKMYKIKRNDWKFIDFSKRNTFNMRRAESKCGLVKDYYLYTLESKMTGNRSRNQDNILERIRNCINYSMELVKWDAGYEKRNRSKLIMNSSGKESEKH